MDLIVDCSVRLSFSELSLSAEFKAFVRRQDNCARCQCRLPCDWHTAGHVTQPA